MSDDGKVTAVGARKIFSKPVGGAMQAFCTIVRWLRGIIAKAYTQREVVGGAITRQELDAFIDSALEILPQRIDYAEEDRAVLIAEGIITTDGELAPEYRSAGDSGKLKD
jgi:hypothetical protein